MRPMPTCGFAIHQIHQITFTLSIGRWSCGFDALDTWCSLVLGNLFETTTFYAKMCAVGLVTVGPYAKKVVFVKQGIDLHYLYLLYKSNN